MTASSSASAALDGEPSSIERARVVVGADGWNSMVARRVGAEQYNAKPVLENAFYTYWSGLAVDEFTTLLRGDRGIAAIPTNDDLTLVLVGCPYAEASEFRRDVEGNYFRALDRARVRRTGRARRPASSRSRAGASPTSSVCPRARLGPGRRRRLHQGPRHRPGHQRRLPQRRTVRRRARRGVHRRALVRRRDGRLPTHARRRRPSHLRVHHPAGHAGTPTPAAAGAARRHRTRTRTRWTPSSASPPARCRRSTSSTPDTWPPSSAQLPDPRRGAAGRALWAEDVTPCHPLPRRMVAARTDGGVRGECGSGSGSANPSSSVPRPTQAPTIPDATVACRPQMPRST